MVRKLFFFGAILSAGILFAMGCGGGGGGTVAGSDAVLGGTLSASSFNGGTEAPDMSGGASGFSGSLGGSPSIVKSLAGKAKAVIGKIVGEGEGGDPTSAGAMRNLSGKLMMVAGYVGTEAALQQPNPDDTDNNIIQPIGDDGSFSMELLGGKCYALVVVLVKDSAPVQIWPVLDPGLDAAATDDKPIIACLAEGTTVAVGAVTQTTQNDRSGHSFPIFALSTSLRGVAGVTLIDPPRVGWTEGELFPPFMRDQVNETIITGIVTIPQVAGKEFIVMAVPEQMMFNGSGEQTQMEWLAGGMADVAADGSFQLYLYSGKDMTFDDLNMVFMLNDRAMFDACEPDPTTHRSPCEYGPPDVENSLPPTRLPISLAGCVIGSACDVGTIDIGTYVQVTGTVYDTDGRTPVAGASVGGNKIEMGVSDTFTPGEEPFWLGVDTLNPLVMGEVFCWMDPGSDPSQKPDVSTCVKQININVYFEVPGEPFDTFMIQMGLADVDMDNIIGAVYTLPLPSEMGPGRHHFMAMYDPDLGFDFEGDRMLPPAKHEGPVQLSPGAVTIDGFAAGVLTGLFEVSLVTNAVEAFNGGQPDFIVISGRFSVELQDYTSQSGPQSGNNFFARTKANGTYSALAVAGTYQVCADKPYVEGVIPVNKENAYIPFVTVDGETPINLTFQSFDSGPAE